MRTTSRMPLFSKSQTKYKARELHIGFLYPLVTGNLTIPQSKGYWYLCNEQPDSEGSEIHQLTKLPRENGGRTYFFARPDQCYGVDRSKIIIRKNRSYDPKLHKKIKKIRPDWFLSQTQIADQKKKQLLDMAKRGLPRPSHDKTKIGQALSNYTRKSSPVYDHDFTCLSAGSPFFSEGKVLSRFGAKSFRGGEECGHN